MPFTRKEVMIRLENIRQSVIKLNGNESKVGNKAGKAILDEVNNIEAIMLRLTITEQDDGANTEYIIRHPEMCIECDGWIQTEGRDFPKDFPSNQICACPLSVRVK